MKTKMGYKGFVGSILFCLLFLNGCQGDSTPHPPPVPSPVPSVPGNVKVFPGHQNVTVQWDSVAGATSYNIYRASNSGINPGNVGNLTDGAKHTASTSPFTVNGLTNGTSYFFVVTAVNSGGESSISAEVKTTPLERVAIALAAGENHTCALIANGTVKCWGENYSGQLGNGESGSPTAITSRPVLVSGINTAIGITAGKKHTCALLADHTVSCWGRGSLGQLGNGKTDQASMPESVTGITDAVAIAAGGEHTCALRLTGTMQCWGQNKDGQLGNGTAAPAFTPTPVGVIKRATLISAGSNHTCADIQESSDVARKVKCWGDNKFGQLGNNESADAFNPDSVRGFQLQNPNLSKTVAVALAAGESHTCAITLDGSVNCWGSDDAGQLGNGTSSIKLKSKIPLPVPGITDARAITAGKNHTCVLVSDYSVACWGRNKEGQVGNGTINNALIPQSVPNLSARIVAAGGRHTCVITPEGGVKCWGDNGFGQLGNGTFANSDVPKLVPGINATAVAAGEGHTCALLTEAGRVACWGLNNFGQVGENGTSTNALSPVTLTGITATSVAAGGNHTCALLLNKTLQCWGKNRHGQLGNGSEVDSNSPVLVQNLTDVTEVALGKDHSCAIQGTSTLSCWGRNDFGQLGSGTFVNSPSPVHPRPFSDGSSTLKHIALGGSHSCAILLDKTVNCWGLNDFGQIGNFTKVDSIVPLPTGQNLLSDVTIIAAGGSYTCAHSTTSSACWGKNISGQLGIGTLDVQVLFPQQVVGVLAMASIKGIAAGDSHACAYQTDGDMACWGKNAFGQLGNGGTTQSNLPVLLLTGVLTKSVTSAAAGKNHTCAVVSPEGKVYCWGHNLYGQLGDGTAGLNPLPIDVLDIP